MQGAGLQLVFRIPDDCEMLTEEKCSMAAFPTTGNEANRQVPSLAGFLDKPDELLAFHYPNTVSDIFVRVSSPIYATQSAPTPRSESIDSGGPLTARAPPNVASGPEFGMSTVVYDTAVLVTADRNEDRDRGTRGWAAVRQDQESDVVDVVVVTTALRNRAAILIRDAGDMERLVRASGRDVAVVGV